MITHPGHKQDNMRELQSYSTDLNNKINLHYKIQFVPHRKQPASIRKLSATVGKSLTTVRTMRNNPEYQSKVTIYRDRPQKMYTHFNGRKLYVVC